MLEAYERPLLVSTERWRELELPVGDRFHGVLPHAERAGVEAAQARAEHAGVLVGLGGGSAIDSAKAVSAATGVPLVAVPTTYAGAEWTPYFGVRDEAERVKGGGTGANTVAIVYEPELTLDLPHGALIAICLPAALRWNDASEPLPVERVEELARLAGFTRLRDLGVPEDELAEVAEATAVRAGAHANPRPATPADIAELLRSVW